MKTAIQYVTDVDGNTQAVRMPLSGLRECFFPQLQSRLHSELRMHFRFIAFKNAAVAHHARRIKVFVYKNHVVEKYNTEETKFYGKLYNGMEQTKIVQRCKIRSEKKVLFLEKKMKKYWLFLPLFLFSATFIVKHYFNIPDFIVGTLQGFAFGILIVVIVKLSKQKTT